MTISPPAKVKLLDGEPARVLCSGVDTLYLAIDVRWPNRQFFDYLQGVKLKAIERKGEYPGFLRTADDTDRWAFNMACYGAKGYEWLLKGCEYEINIANSLEPGQRPSVYVLIHSETLHHLGVVQAVDRVVGLLGGSGAAPQVVKVSRADLYADVLLPEAQWRDSLRSLMVTRAAKRDPHYRDDVLTGFSIGKGAISARLYDKPLEIRQQSKKVWMFDKWGLEAVPEGCRIIRVEFQLRRQALKELGISTFGNLMALGPRLWGYCTGQWLKLQDNPGKHHTQRETLPWWEVVQKGFAGAQAGCPLVRGKAIKADLRRAGQQFVGSFTTCIAIMAQHLEVGDKEPILLADWLPEVKGIVRGLGVTDELLTARVHRKLAKFKRFLKAPPGGGQ